MSELSQQVAQTSETVAAMAAKAAPPVSVSVAHISGMTPSDILVWMTIAYTVLMFSHKAWQFYQDVKSKRKGSRRV